MLLGVERARERVNVLNLGAADFCTVNDSIGWITTHLGLSPTIEYAGGERGWIGDSPFIWLDASRMRGLGWEPRQTIRDGVIRTLDWLRANEWVLERRR
jgi:UDP-glucose 4-epimerase